MHAVNRFQLRRPCSGIFDHNDELLYYTCTYTRSLCPQTAVSQSAAQRRNTHLCKGASARRRNMSATSLGPLDTSTLPRTTKPLVPWFPSLVGQAPMLILPCLIPAFVHFVEQPFENVPVKLCSHYHPYRETPEAARA